MQIVFQAHLPECPPLLATDLPTLVNRIKAIGQGPWPETLARRRFPRLHAAKCAGSALHRLRYALQDEDRGIMVSLLNLMAGAAEPVLLSKYPLRTALDPCYELQRCLYEVEDGIIGVDQVEKTVHTRVAAALESLDAASQQRGRILATLRLQEMVLYKNTAVLPAVCDFRVAFAMIADLIGAMGQACADRVFTKFTNAARSGPNP